MITIENLKECLLYLGFKDYNSIFLKKYKELDYEMCVNFDQEKLDYGNKVMVNDETTSNFSKNENFVVFECVDRLLCMGYRPEDIELEPKWTLGHDEKGGKADIVIHNSTNAKKNDILMIIECKTFGKEYDKEYKNTISDGGQLFSYLQQEKSTKWLSIYTSEYIDGKVIYKTNTIKVFDDTNILKLAEKDDTILLYKNSNNKDEMFEVWDETYEKRFVGDVIFSEDSSAYQIDIKPLRKKDLKDFTPDDNVVNKFEEILRHNNISDKENAFNRLIALFIAKLADEIEKDDDDIVDFQYKVGTDTFESLQDRLQRLHKDGMEKFMNEEIMYIDDNYAEDLVKQYTGQRRKNMICDLKETIKKLKFYTNNDFTFKDVHNEELFLQNGKVLIEVVELFQNFKIVDPKQANVQFLGDMFEQLLNKGFKQNEGQFFTPNQITRFIWESLPLKKLMLSGSRIKYPKVIDFACGAGHFIIQGVAIIKKFLHEENINYKELHPDKYFYGIEKDYRLARVSRVSMYMNDCDEGNIIFGDGLDNYKDKGVDNGNFDILVANPPFSVKEFKAHLKLKNNSLELLTSDYITNQGSEIQTCFVERINQLLKPNGIAAIILPSSLLIDNGGSFKKAREEIFFNFRIRGMVEMGSETFGKTDQPTTILFLEKFNEPPKRVLMIKDSIEQIFNGNISIELDDIDIYKNFINIINVDDKTYRSFIKKEFNIDCIRKENYKYFNNLYNEFIKTNDYKSKIKSKTFKSLRDVEKESIINELFYKFAFAKEKEKMIYFALTYNNETLIITLPIDIKEQRDFLGYKFSDRKGFEGIEVFRDGGKLFNANGDENIYAADLIRAMYLIDDSKSYISVESELLKGNYHKMMTNELLDFNKGNFSNALNTIKKAERNYNFDVKKYSLSDSNIFEVIIGNRVLQEEIIKDGKYPIYSANVKEAFGRIDKLNIKDFSKPSILWGIDGEFTTNIIDKNIEFYPTDHCGVLRIKTKDIMPLYAMYALQFEGNIQKYSRTNRADIERIKTLNFYIPSVELQKEFCEKVTKIDYRVNCFQKNIDILFSDLQKEVLEIAKIANQYQILDETLITVRNSTNKIPESKILKNGNVPVITQERSKLINGYVNTNDFITDIPVILFGDHTCCFKYIDFNFVRGADGTQLIKTDNRFNLKYLYYYLTTIKIQNSEKYERHFKYLKNIELPLVSVEVQQNFEKFAIEKETERNNLIIEKEKLLKEKDDLIRKFFK